MESCEWTEQEVRFTGRALVADDIRANQILMKALLTKFGLEVALAGDGREAVQKALSEAYDVIFMDIQMPNMDGYEATRALREQGRTLPIVALTAHANNADQTQCRLAGCDDYLSKPVDKLRLIETLRKYLHLAEAPPAGCASAKSQARLGAAAAPIMVSDTAQGETVDCGEANRQPVIDWNGLASRGFDEELVQRVMPMCIEDNRERLQKLTLALRAHNVEEVRSQAHAMKGSFANVGAVELAQVACCLEDQAKTQDLSAAERLLSSMENGFQKLQSLVSKPGWVQLLKEQTMQVAALHRN